MAAFNLNRRAVWLGLGVAIGLVVGGLWPQAPLHAVATDRQENFAICTGLIDEEVEALYFLDFLTGDLKGAVLNTNTGTFNAFFSHNVLNDLQIDISKEPKYLIVTGMGRMRRTAGRAQPGNGIVYVAELTSGNVAAYAVPWVGTPNTPAPIEAPFILMDLVPFRTSAVRDDE